MNIRIVAKSLIGIGLLLCVANVSAQNDSIPNKLNVNLNYLTHGEVCGGGLPKSESAVVEDFSSFLLGRVRLSVDYTRPGLVAHATIQNSAVWGSTGNMSLNLYEGWVKLSAKNGFFAQLGRVALAYDDERIIGPNDFAMAALSHDVLRMGYEGHGHRAHAILAYNQNGANVYANTYYASGAQLYKTMQTFWYHYDVPSFPLGASLLFINMGMQAGLLGDTNLPASVEYQQMFGGYVKYAPKHFSLEASYYRQQGKEVNAAMQAGEIEAWMASVKAVVTPSDRYGLEMGYDYLSGDDYVPVTYGGTLGLPRHAIDKGFNPIYGSRSQFYGILDYFYKEAYINDFTPGLQNAFIGIFGKPTGRLSCGITYHYLATATDLRKLDRTLGHAVDLQASYKFSKDITLAVGYTQMSGTETMDRLKQGNGDKNARWGWFSLVISPNLFSRP